MFERKVITPPFAILYLSLCCCFTAIFSVSISTLFLCCYYTFLAFGLRFRNTSPTCFKLQNFVSGDRFYHRISSFSVWDYSPKIFKFCLRFLPPVQSNGFSQSFGTFNILISSLTCAKFSHQRFGICTYVVLLNMH